MTNAIGIPTTRVSDLLVRQRVLAQVQNDLREMLQLENQLSSGHQFELPSQNPVAASRVISLQGLLERKEQVKINLSTTQSYLGATDVALSRISSLVNETRGVALSAVGTPVTDEQRAAVIDQIQEAVWQLIYAGNQQFRDRYLFAGSTASTKPFEALDNNIVEYLGNEGLLRSYSDLDVLTTSNLNGNTAFGAISEPVRGSADLNPILTYNTRLTDLNGGEGVSSGSFSISDGSHTSIVDISTAETIGDVAALIRANPPDTRTIDVEITATGLVIELDAAPGDLSIWEVSGGSTAFELGILQEIGVGNNPIVGDDLDPVLRKTTRLADVFGARAAAVVRSAGADNDLIIEANVRGATDAAGNLLNTATISFVDDAAVGSEWVAYTPSAVPGVSPTIEVHIKAGMTRAEHVVTAINAAGGMPFTARLDPLEEQDGGQGLIAATATGETSGGSGSEFDQDSGLQILNGNNTYTISFASDDTIEDVLNRLNGAGAGLLAEINESATGIDVRSRLSGAALAIGENGGTTATQLGLRTFTEETRLENLNYGGPGKEYGGVDDYEGGGTKAYATHTSVGDDNDLTIQASNTGIAWNGFAIEFIDSGGPPGSEAVTYDPAAKTITFEIVPDSTTANDLIQLMDITPGLTDDFEIELVSLDGSPNNGTGLVGLGSAVTAGGYSEDFQITRADGVRFEIDISGAETIGDVLARINNHVDNTPLPNGDPGLVARLAVFGSGIELVDHSIGPGSLTVAGTASTTTAVDLGLIPAGQETGAVTTAGALATGVWDDGSDINNELLVTAKFESSYLNGVTLNVHDDGNSVGNVPILSYNAATKVLDIEIENGFTTANDVITELGNTPAVDALFTITNDGASNGTGLLDATDPNWQTFSMADGQSDTLTGVDVHPLETEGIFTALLRLQQGFQENDEATVMRAFDLLDAHALQANFARAELGVRQQGLDFVSERLQSEEVELRQVLSLEYDADFVEVVSNLAGRQAALEAGLMTTAEILKMSLFNYL